MRSQLTIAYQEKLKAGVWTTEDGREIPIKEMTTPHLQQTIGYLRKTNWWLAEEWIKLMQAELENRK